MKNNLYIDGVHYLTAREAGDVLGYAPDYVSRLCREGKLRGRRSGKSWIVEADSLVPFIKAHEAKKLAWHQDLSRELKSVAEPIIVRDENFEPLSSVRVAPRQLHILRASQKAHAAREAAQTLMITRITVSSVFAVLLLFVASTTALSTPIANMLRGAAVDQVAAASFFSPLESIARTSYSSMTSIACAITGWCENVQPMPVVYVRAPQQAVAQDSAATQITNNITNYIQPTVGSGGVLASGISEQLLDSRLNTMENYLTGRIDLLAYEGQRQTEDLAEDFANGMGGGGFDDIDITDSSFSGGSLSGSNWSGGSISGTSITSSSFEGDATTTNLYIEGSFGFGTSSGLLQTTNGTASTLANGGNGQVLKMVGGNLAWSTDLTGGGGGGGASFFASTTDDLAIYPADPDDVLIVGGSATTTVGNILEIAGNSLFRGAMTSYGNVTAPRFTATSSVASVFPYASTTAISTNSLCISGDCRQAWPTDSAFSTTSADYLQTQRNYFSTTSADFWKTANSFFSTTSADAWKDQRNFFSTTSASYFLSQNQGAAFSTTSASYFLSTQGSLGFSTTSNDYWMTQRNFFSTSSADYYKSVNDFFSTTSADAWKLTRDFFSTTSASYFLAQNQGTAFSSTSASYFLSQNAALGFSTTSANYFVSSSTTLPKTYSANTFTALQTFGNASSSIFSANTICLSTDCRTSWPTFTDTSFSTTSADYWQTQRNFFSTTSASYFAASGLAFSTTSNDYWKSVNDFFSTTSADAWKLTRDFFSTSSASYFLSQNGALGFSTTSANYFVSSSTTIPKTYTANTFTSLQVFSSASSTLFSSSYASSTNIFAGTLCLTGDICRTTWPTAGSSFAYPFSLSGNATSTLTQFNGGLTAFASSTIGNGTAAGGLTVSGTATTSRLVVTSTATSTFAGGILMSGSIVPSVDDTYSLGSPSLQWRDVYIGPGSLYINGQKVLEDDGPNIVITADPGQNIAVQSQGTGDIELSPLGTGVIQLKGDVQLTAGKSLTMSDNSAVSLLDGAALGNITISGNTIQATNTNGGISITPAGNGSTYITSGNLGIGTTSPGSKLSIQGNIFLAGNIISTSTTASQFPFASTTALSAATLCLTGDSCIASWPTFTDISFSTTSANYWQTTRDFFSTTSAQYFSHSSTTIPKTYTSNTFTALQSFANASSTLFSASYASTTALFANTASTSNLTISALQNGLLKTGANGIVSLAVAGTDYSNFAYPFGLTGNATSTLTQFNGGLTAFASTTVGGGSTTTGLTINGGATTTGTAYFAGNVGIGTSTPSRKLSVAGATFFNTSTGPFITLDGSGRTDNASLISWTGANGTFSLNAGTNNNRRFDLDYTDGGTIKHGISGQRFEGLLFYSGNGLSEVGRFNTSGNLGIGTTSPGSKLSVAGNIFVTGNIISTSTTASQFPFASTTALSASALCLSNDCIASWPTFTDTSFSTTSADYWQTTRDFFSTTSANFWKSANDFFSTTSLAYHNSVTDLFSTTSANFFAHSSTTIPKTYTANTFTALQNFANASSTLFSASYASTTALFANTASTSNLTISALQNGLLKVSATGVVSLATAGTDFSTFAYPFPANATSTLLSFNGGLTAYASSTIGDGTQAGGLTINGGATTTGSVSVGTYGVASTSLTVQNAYSMSGLGIESDPIGGASVGVFGLSTQVGGKFYGNEWGIVATGPQNLISGNLGVGTDPGSNKLHVTGNGVFEGEVEATYFTASWDTASVFPYASTTALSATSLCLASDCRTSWPSGITYPFSLAGNATSTLTQFNGGLTAYASSTIGNGAQAGGLTINGGATTTGFLTVQGAGTSTFTGGIASAAGGITGGATGLNLYGGGTNQNVNIHPSGSGLFAIHGSSGPGGSTSWGFRSIMNASAASLLNIGDNGLGNIRFQLNTSGIVAANTGYFGFSSGGISANGTTPDTIIGRSGVGILSINSGAGTLSTGRVGVGTSSPLGLLTIAATSTTGVGVPQNLFFISSSTAGTATTTLFSISNTGSTTASNGFNITAGCYAINGTCITGGGGASFAYPFLLNGNATSTLTQFNGGLTAFASSTIGGGTQITGLTISGGATTTGNSLIQGLLSAGTTTLTNLIVTNLSTSTFNGDLRIIPRGALSNRYIETSVEGTTRPILNFVGADGDGAAIRTTNANLRLQPVTGIVGIGATGLSTNILQIGSTTDASLNVFGRPGIYNPNNGQSMLFTTANSDGGTDSFVFNQPSGSPRSIFKVSNAGTAILTIAPNGNVGIGTTTPWAKLSLHANSNETATTLFAIASSTNAATSTLFSVTNTGVAVVNDPTNSTGSINGFQLVSPSFTTKTGLFSRYAASSAGWALFSGGTANIAGTLNYTGPFVNQMIGFSSSGVNATNPDTAFHRLSTNTISLGGTTAGSVNGTFVAERIGLGTTTPYAQLSIIATSTNGLGGPRTLFAIASTTGGTSTTTLFSISNTGSTTASNGFNITAGCYAVNDICITGSSSSFAYPFGLTGNATSTLTQFNGGLTAYASSTIGGGTQTTGLTISGGATTTGNAYFAGNVGIGTTNTSPIGSNAEGIVLKPGGISELSTSGAPTLWVNRVQDGGVVSIASGGSTEGTISISGTTVSYNAFTGSHYGTTINNEDIERGSLVELTGKQTFKYGNSNSEPTYEVRKTVVANSPVVLGAMLSLMEPQEAHDPIENPYLIMAVGNGDMWVTQGDEDTIEPGDYLISSAVPGHAMKDPGTYMVSHIVARAAQRIDWNTIASTTSTGVKRVKISITFEQFDRNATLDQAFAAVFATSSASSTDAHELQTFASSFLSNLFARMNAWLADAGNGITEIFAKTIRAENVYADTVTANKLCLEDVCVTKAQLQQMLNNSGSAPTPTPEPATEEPSDEPDAEEPAPEPEVVDANEEAPEESTEATQPESEASPTDAFSAPESSSEAPDAEV